MVKLHKTSKQAKILMMKLLRRKLRERSKSIKTWIYLHGIYINIEEHTSRNTTYQYNARIHFSWKQLKLMNHYTDGLMSFDLDLRFNGLAEGIANLDYKIRKLLRIFRRAHMFKRETPKWKRTQAKRLKSLEWLKTHEPQAKKTKTPLIMHLEKSITV